MPKNSIWCRRPRYSLIGRDFGRLTVKSQTLDERGRAVWLCDCSCGGSRLATTSALMRKAGSTKSCGCWRAGKGRNLAKEHVAKISGPNAKHWKGGCTNKGSVAYFKALINANNWHVEKSGYCKIAVSPEYLVAAFAEANDTCHLCGIKGPLAIDHCHKTGRFRKFICRACNHVLGLCKDDSGLLSSMAAYIERHNEPAAILRDSVTVQTSDGETFFGSGI